MTKQPEGGDAGIGIGRYWAHWFGSHGGAKARGHGVLALTRSNASAEKAARLGAAVMRGDIATPETWVPALPPVDAVIHAASDSDSNMAKIDQRLLDVLLPHLAAQPQRPRFLYTGGNWLFGATGDAVATEESVLA